MRAVRKRNLIAWIVGPCAALFLLAGAVISVADAHGVTNRQENGFCRRVAPSRDVARNPWSRARETLAPGGAQSISLCRYASGKSGYPSLKLAGNDEVTSRSTKRQLISKFNALKQYHGPPFHCPPDSGDEVLATLFYRQHKVRIIVTLTGCPTATNGDITRFAFNFDGKNPAGPRLLQELERLTRHRRFQGA